MSINKMSIKSLESVNTFVEICRIGDSNNYITPYIFYGQWGFQNFYLKFYFLIYIQLISLIGRIIIKEKATLLHNKVA